MDSPRLLAPWTGRMIVLATSAAFMIMEIAAGRVIAPALGVSLYTWTSVIASVLIGMDMGSALGGRMADQYPSRERLSLTCIGAGIVILISGFFPRLLGDLSFVIGMDVWLRILFYSFIVFLPPACALSLIYPQVAKLTLADVRCAGRIVGALGAWAAFGSIVGTYAAGFWLIALVGADRLMMLAAAMMACVGIGVSSSRGLWRSKYAFAGAALLASGLALPSVCLRETNYYCVRVVKDEQHGEGGRIIRLDHLIHSYVLLNKPGFLGYSYEQVYANLIAARARPEDAFQTFFIGGGGYVLPRYLNAFYPNAGVTVSEIDPQVTEVNRQYLGLAKDTNIRSIHADARMALEKNVADDTLDLVFGDAFNDFSVPHHLTTVEFHRLLKHKMKANGAYAMNVIDDAKHGQFLAAMIRTLRSVWEHVEVAPQTEGIANGRNTYVLIASDAPLDRAAWENAHPFSEQDDENARASREKNMRLLTPDEIEKFLNQHPEPALTDDFVPTDAYLAPVFREAY